jgi:hypothetical protein
VRRIVGIIICFWVFWACEPSNPDPVVLEYHVPEIPVTRLAFDNPELSKDSTGALLFAGVKYSGFMEKVNSRGELIEVTSYFEGFLEGDMLGYYPSGRKRYIRPYRNGKKQGAHFGYYVNGAKQFHYIFEKGKSEGNHLVWFKDGSVFKDLNYKNGRPFGSQKVWRRDGKIRSNYVIRENGRRYGLMGIKRCTKLDTEKEEFDPYEGKK